jgi:hypothetical protein
MFIFEKKSDRIAFSIACGIFVMVAIAFSFKGENSEKEISLKEYTEVRNMMTSLNSDEIEVDNLALKIEVSRTIKDVMSDDLITKAEFERIKTLFNKKAAKVNKDEVSLEQYSDVIEIMTVVDNKIEGSPSSETIKLSAIVKIVEEMMKDRKITVSEYNNLIAFISTSDYSFFHPQINPRIIQAYKENLK